jgi:phage antirepressor YoqD-like protein
VTQLDILSMDTASPFDSIRKVDERGEHWTGSDLMPLMDYGRRHEFMTVIEKAKASLALVQGEEQATHHFGIQHSDGGRWGNRSVTDYRMTRFGAYLVAMAGDDTKEAVARARIYFAVKAREAEVAPVRQEFALPGSYADALRELASTVERAALAETKVVELEPKAAQAEHYRAAEGQTAIGDFANDLALWAKEVHGVKILQVEVRKFMAEIGLLILGETIRNGQPTADAQKRDLLRIKHTTFETNTRGTQSGTSARLTQKGCGYVWDRATRRIAEHGSLAPITSVERKFA